MARADLQIPAAPPAGWAVAANEVLPMVPLRGYGALGSQFVRYKADGRECSVLLVQSADAARAAIALGKFREDATNLGGVSDGLLSLGTGKVPVLAVAGRGTILAVREKDRFAVITGSRDGDVTRFLTALGYKAGGQYDFAGKTPPIYLDKFDKYGFGFWCPDPLRAPPKQEDSYDVREKFDWAKKMGVALQFDGLLNQNAGAAGILDDHNRAWAFDLTRQMGIPVMLQMQGAPAPDWLANEYVDEMQQKVPQFVGSWYGINGFNGFFGSPQRQVSWASVTAKDRLIADQCQAVKKYQGYSNVTGYGEIHGEVGEGSLAMFMDYGPVADARYRDFLKEKYGTVAAVDERWYGGRGTLKSWDEVRMPEPANFLGWDDKAFDLKGEWRVKDIPDFQAEEKDRWGDPALDDGPWRKLVAPGDDAQVFKQKRAPAVFRRHFTISADKLAGLKVGGKVFLYALTLERQNYDVVKAVVNGKALPDQQQRSLTSWSVFDVTDCVRPGENVLALSLPQGELSYRTYLSGWEPRPYPALGPEMNARWVDYRDFITWMREDCLRRSIEGIRREDPDKFIKLYAPHAASDVMKSLAQDYGCYFHDTGGMSGIWQDSLCGLMRSSGLPSSLEPGGPPADVAGLKYVFGVWSTEGLQCVDYFMDVGNVLWNPDQKAWFEAHQPLVHLLGKYHYPQAQVAVLQGARFARLTGFPWDQFDTPLLWGWRKRGVGTLGVVPGPRDLINEIDFEKGNVSKYKVIIDDSTMVMDEALVSRIEQWVRAGGIFVTQGMTGRHTPEVQDAWPISRLTGYENVGGNDNSRIRTLPGQPIFKDTAWTQTEPNGRPVLLGAGQYMRKVAPECQDVAVWEKNDAVAIGYRPLGKGKVVTVGVVMPNAAGPGSGMAAWSDLLSWCGEKPEAVATAPGCRTAHFVSNNGLYDVYVVWAENVKAPGTVTLRIPGTRKSMLNLTGTGSINGEISEDGQSVIFANFPVEPMETYAFLAPRDNWEGAAREWLGIQTSWWKGTVKPRPAPKVAPHTETVSLEGTWAFKSIADSVTSTDELAAPTTDTSGWMHRDLGIWYGEGVQDTRHGIFRRKFTVPAAWVKSGRTWLWLRSNTSTPFLPPYKARVFLDGRVIYDAKGWKYASVCQDITPILTGGEQELAIEAQTSTVIGGVSGNMWLEHLPEPVGRQSLAGDWSGFTLPGVTKASPPPLTREFKVDRAAAGKRIYLYVETTRNNVTSVTLNGRRISRNIGGFHFLMDVTPYLDREGTNTLSLGLQFGDPLELTAVELRFFDGPVGRTAE